MSSQHRSDTRTGIQAGSRLRKADLHVHSNFSPDVPNLAIFSPRALYRRAVEEGMDFFALTDHDTIDGVEVLRRDLREEFGDHWPIPVITGVELKVLDPSIGHTIHINVLGLERRHLDALMTRRRSIGRFVAYCRRKGLFCAYNHPFWFEHGERPNLDAIERLVRLIPVVELNAGRIRELNHRTARLARKYRKPFVAASDTHTGQVGKAYTLAPGETPEAYLRNIMAGHVRVTASHFVLQDFLGEIRETIDLALRGTPAKELRESIGLELARPYRIAQRILTSSGLLQSARARRGLGRFLKVIARGPAHIFLRRQRRMVRRLGSSGYA
ncbi:MAG: PHP domain-containing protein [Candidatus Eisenbacteria sp.]|nr:PHP domain-containing protein [Candidatus Eisenbacteria bacterium]